jgi:hypothetical protein
MLHKKNNSYTIWVAVSLIALILLTTSGLNHSYTTAFAVSKKKGGSSGTSSKSSSGGGFTISGTSSSSSSATTANPNALTKKELSTFISCINTANKSTEGLTHKVATNCLDTAKGITPPATTTAGSSSTTTGRSSSIGSSPSLTPSAGSST